MARFARSRRAPFAMGAVLWILSAPGDLTFPTAMGQETDRADAIKADVVYGHKDGLALTMDIYRPTVEPNGAGILFMVSGGWFSRWAPPERSLALFQPYLDEGYTMFAVRHGSSPRYSIPEAISDVRQAVRFVRREAANYSVDPERLGVMGMSAGGHLALVLGTTGDDGDEQASGLDQQPSRVAAVVALVPPTDLRVAVWSSPDSLPAYRGFPALNLEMEKASEASPLVHVTPDDAPSLVIMGGKDELVPAKHGEWIAEKFDDEGVVNKLIIFPDSGHGLDGEGNLQRVVDETRKWFGEHLSLAP